MAVRYSPEGHVRAGCVPTHLNMIPIFAALLAVAPQTPPTVTEIQARIPKTRTVVSLDLCDWREDREQGQALGDKLLFAGTMAPRGSVLSVIVEPNVPPVAPTKWRERLAPAGTHFNVQFTPCVDASAEIAPGMLQSDYHAFFATREHVLHVHASRLTDGTDDKEAFPRSEFERIVKSLRVRLLRRGWAEDYPDAIGVPMTMAAVLGVDQKAWQEKYLTKHAEDWPAHFANAEYLLHLGAPLEQQLAAYDKAIALMGKIDKPDGKTRFAIAMLHEGKSLALYGAKRHADSIAPLEQCCAILKELAHRERGGPAYHLARAHALCKREAPALDALRRAIEADAQFRDRAAEDADFASLADKPAFRKLLATPARKDPPKN